MTTIQQSPELNVSYDMSFSISDTPYPAAPERRTLTSPRVMDRIFLLFTTMRHIYNGHTARHIMA